jgi:hypothetical protein
LNLLVRFNTAQKTEFAEELKTIERTTLQQMKLDKHFKEAEQTRIPAAYIFCNYIKTLKPNIPLDFYITRKAYREKFVAWSSEAPPSQPGAEPTRWSQVYDFKNPDPLGVKTSVDLNAYSKGTQLDYLDIKSHQFKPSLFIKRVHSTTSAEELKKGLQNLLKAYNESAGNFSALIKTNAGVFSECNALLDDVRRDMEGLQKEGGLVTGARKSLSNLVELENSILNPILEKKRDVERIRNIIKLTQKYSYLFKLPGLLESLHNRNDIDGIVELYQKHVKVIKQHANLPIFAKVSSKVDGILAGVKESIISMVNRERTPTYEAIAKAIRQMNVLDSRKNPRKIFLGQLHKKINSYIYRMWDKASNPYDIPWIIKEETGTSTGTNAFELAGSTTAMDQILEKTLERTIQNLEVFDKLAGDYIAKKSNTTSRSSKHKGRPAKILKMQEETSHTLTTRLSYSLFEKNSKIREFNLQLVSDKLAVLEKYLPTTTFKEFIDLFESCVVNTVSQSLLRDARDLWKEEAWSKDYENKYGTCMPRVFETVAMKEIYRIKNILRGNNHLKHLSEGILEASLGLCIAMEKAIGNTGSVLHTNVVRFT